MTKTRKYSLLFVDDEPRITTALKAIFRRDYDVYIANSGADALKILEQREIDVVVSDQRMPGMLGNELLATISRRFPRTMRVLLTGFTDKQAIIDSINEGEIYRFVNKPWRNDELKEMVAEAALASEVVLEEDEHSAVANAASNAAKQASSADLSGSAVLMMEHSQDVRNQIRRMGQNHKLMVYGTQSIEQAIAAGSSRKAIGVAVIELSNNPEPALRAIHALKRVRPDVITIALADEYDAQIAIDLINQGQVYKYLTTPLNEESIADTIKAAFSRHHLLRKRPEMQRRYKVDTGRGRIVSGLQDMFARLIGGSQGLSNHNA